MYDTRAIEWQGYESSVFMRRDQRWKKLPGVLSAGCVVLCCVIAAGAGCGLSRRVRAYREAQWVIGTYVQVDVCADPADRISLESAMREVWENFEHVQNRMNAYDPESDIGRINQADGAMTIVHDDVYALLQKAVVFAENTEGAFDITVRPLIGMWQRAQADRRLPHAEEIASVKSRVGTDRIHFFERDDGAGIICDGCQIDLGGIAKGYAVDQAAGILRRHGFENFLIDAGGDMYAGGQNCFGRPWRIGVRHPRLKNELISIFEISNQAVTTSGDYEQFYEIEGRRFSHIIDPVSGYPQTGVISATVVAPTAIEADVFSTVLCVRSPARGLALIDDKGPDYGALVILEDEAGEIHQAHTVLFDRLRHFRVLNTRHITK